MLFKMGVLNEDRRKALIRFSNSLKSMAAQQQNIFEGMNIRYFGPINGHDVKNLARILRDIKDMQGPKILHLHTVRVKASNRLRRSRASGTHPANSTRNRRAHHCRHQQSASSIPNRIRRDVSGIGREESENRRGDARHAHRMFHEHIDASHARPGFRRRHRRRTRRHILRRYGKRRSATFLQHIFVLHAAGL